MNRPSMRSLGIGRVAGALAITLSVGACSGSSWKEEVQLHDGQKIIIERSIERGGRSEIGQAPPIKEQRLSFQMPGADGKVEWFDKFSEDTGGANFLPMLLDIDKGVAYLVVYPMGCQSYNKWGRPNPPYVVFGYQANAWQRVPLEALPQSIKTPNLVFSNPDDTVQRLGARFVTAQMIQNIVKETSQAEYKTILRARMPEEMMCEKLERYKGKWIRPGDPLAKQWVDSQEKK